MSEVSPIKTDGVFVVIDGTLSLYWRTITSIADSPLNPGYCLTGGRAINCTSQQLRDAVNKAAWFESNLRGSVL